MGTVLGDEPVLHEHRGAHLGAQALGDVGGHRLQVGLHGVVPLLDELRDVHEQLVHDRAQPLGRQLPRPGPPGACHGPHLLRGGVRAQPEQREQGGRGGSPVSLPNSSSSARTCRRRSGLIGGRPAAAGVAAGSTR